MFGAATSAASASSQNKIASDQMRSSYASAKANNFLNNLANDAQIRKLSNQYAQYTKSVDTSAAVRNVAGSQSSEAIRRASLASALEDVTNIQRTGDTQATAIWANATSEINRARSMIQNPWMAGISGGLQGLQTGLAIAGSLNAAGAFSGAGGAAAGAGTVMSSTAGPSGFSSPTAQSIGNFRLA